MFSVRPNVSSIFSACSRLRLSFSETPVPHFAYTNLLDNSEPLSALHAQRRRSAACKLRNRLCRLRHVDCLAVAVLRRARHLPTLRVVRR